MALAEDMKKIKDAELDIELLHRNNETLCNNNNKDISILEERIKSIEFIIQDELKASKEDKLECKFDNYKGSASWQKMPDEWKHDDKNLIVWTKLLPKNLSEQFIKMVISLRWNDLKKQIIDYNDGLFKDGKIIEEYLNTDVAGCELFLHTEEKDYRIPNIKIKRQDPKFKYSIKKIKK